MADIIYDPLFEEDAGLSLYLRLKPDSRVDLKVAALTAIAWADALRAASDAINPDVELLIELVDADEGSLIFNTVLRWKALLAGSTALRLVDGYRSLPRAARLALALVNFLIFTAGPAYDTYFSSPDFTDQDRADVKEILRVMEADPALQKKRKEFYSAAERDRNIEAVGAKLSPSAPPIVIVDRNRFAEASGLWSDEDADVQQRSNSIVMEVVLVKPALKAAPRTWTFEQPGIGTFDAVMRDPDVLSAMANNGLPERLREGIPMKIRIETHEEARDGEWKVVRGGRIVTRVIEPKID